MQPQLRKLQAAIVRSPGRSFFSLSLSVALVVIVIAAGFAAYLLHLNLSAISSIYLLVVVLTSLRWGLLHATVASIASVACMNYLFIPPVFQLQISDPQNWISLATFETAAMVVSRLSSKVVQHAQHAEMERKRTAKLYELSRAILLIDGRKPTGEQLAALIREILHVQSVRFWVVYDAGAPLAAKELGTDEHAPETIFQTGKETDGDEATGRLLRIGTTGIGAMVLAGWSNDPLLADAVASLAAIAFERARAIQSENHAEAERNAEQLRTAVLDGLAHGFKTPLTAIQTASSGLLAIDQMTPVQLELVSIIDEQSSMLGRMTTRLLQTAALESRDIRLHRARTSLLPFVREILASQDEAVRSRTRISSPPDLLSIDLDRELVRLAVGQLIDNAVKYSYVNRDIDVVLRQDTSETTLIVTNQGPVIQPDERERIFHRFYRGSHSVHAPSGTGLGLSVVKKTAEAHGGRAWVECDGGGTRFCFTVENYRGAAVG